MSEVILAVITVVGYAVFTVILTLEAIHSWRRYLRKKDVRQAPYIETEEAARFYREGRNARADS